MQAKLDFQKASYHLELLEMMRNMVPEEEIHRMQDEVYIRCQSMEFGELVGLVNERLCVQLSEMFQHLADLDSGDTPVEAVVPTLPETEHTAAERPSIGPSTHTNPLMTMDMRAKLSAAEDEKNAKMRQKITLMRRMGYSVWLGPSQAPTSSHVAGVFLRGRAMPGQVVGLFPGAVYNSEMRQKAIDFGHFANPKVPRVVLPRYDDCIIDVHGAKPAAFNPFAIAHHTRHPPAGIAPNCMRLQCDFIDADNNQFLRLAFPKHLRAYIPNQWGSLTTGGQAVHGALEDSIYMKGMVLIATREVFDEELFVDHRLNPYQSLPAWYRPLDVLQDQRTWMQLAGRRPTDPVHDTAQPFAKEHLARRSEKQQLEQ